MQATKLLDLPNDGKPDMLVDGPYLYIRSMRAMFKYALADMSLAAHNVVFKKEGKARGFSIHGGLIFLVDYLDLYILREDDLQVLDVVRLGEDQSSDVGSVLWYDAPKAYVKIRGGKIYVLDIKTKSVEKHDVLGSSFWAHCVAGKCLFAGTVQGELAEIDRTALEVTRKVTLGRMNIYSVIHQDGVLYTISQDTSIKAVDITSFEVVRAAKKAARGMSGILGIHGDTLVVADSGQIALWDKQSLELRGRFDFPVNRYNGGVTLAGNRLFGSDLEYVYSAELD